MAQNGNPAYGDLVGPGSRFRAIAGVQTMSDQGNGYYKITVRYYVEVHAGSSGFGNTIAYCSWRSGSFTMAGSNSTFAVAITDITYDQPYGSYMDIPFGAWYNRTNGTQFKSEAKFQYTVPTPSASYNLNILLPDGSEPYTTGTAGSVEVSVNNGSYTRMYNEPTSAYTVGTTFKYRNFTPGTGMYLSSVTGATKNSDGTYSTTMTSSGLSVNFYTAWNTYTVSYNNNGGSGSISSQSFTHGNSVTLNNGANFSKTGHTFNGWNTNSAGTGTNYTAGSSYTPNANITLYAKWKVNTYTVSYNANGGSGAPGNQTKTYGTNLTLSSTTPTRTGYTFKNWNTKADGTGTSYSSGGAYSSNSGVTLYAQWTIISYAITYYGNIDGATNVPGVAYKNYGTSVTIAPGPSKAGYRFLKWNTQADGTGTNYNAGASYSSNAALNLYAQWQVTTKITLSPSVGNNKYIISNTSDGKANLVDLSIPFTINTITDNANLKYYYKIYYKVGNNKIQVGNSSYGGVTPASVGNKGNFIFTGNMIKEYIQATGNINNLVFYIETYTETISADMQASDITVTIPINNYTKPFIEVALTERLQSGDALVKVRVTYPLSYSINSTNVYPSILLDGIAVIVSPSSVVDEGGNIYLYTYFLTSAQSAGNRALSVIYSDNLYDALDNSRLPASYDDLIIKILRSGALSAVEFIESDDGFKFSKDGKVYASIFSEVF